MALMLAGAGAEVGITYRSRHDDALFTLEAITKLQAPPAWARAADVSIEEDVNALFDHVDNIWPDGVDIFIANAGVWPVPDAGLEAMTTCRWRSTIGTNLDGVFLTTRAAAQRLRRGGRVVIVGSRAGAAGEPLHADYSASKGALTAFTKSIAVELAARDITVNCVAPGWIRTEMVGAALREPIGTQIARSIPLGRIAACDDVAGPILFLCSDLARHVTGTVLDVNGGARP